MPEKKKKKEEKDEEPPQEVVKDEVGDTFVNPETAPLKKIKNKTIHISPKIFERLGTMQAETDGKKVETFSQVLEHLLNIAENVRRVLILEDPSALVWKADAIEDMSERIAKHEEKRAGVWKEKR